MEHSLRIALAQMNFLVGAIEQNTSKILEVAQNARDLHKADIIIFPELCLCGYPPEDLLFRNDFLERIMHARHQLMALQGIILIIGLPRKSTKGLKNCVEAYFNQRILCQYEKCHLPNYSVFDEQRYFTPGHTQQNRSLTYKETRLSFGICEDYWTLETATALKEQNTDIMISINASPFSTVKHETRLKIMQQNCRHINRPMIYLNLVGGQDELVYDGNSFIMNANGTLSFTAQHCEEQLHIATYDTTRHCFLPCNTSPNVPTPEARIYHALVLGLRDYVKKNHFKGGLIGLSGGIDSALTLAIAVDALGKECVTAVMMPFHYTSPMSLEDAHTQTQRLGVCYRILPIVSAYDAIINTLSSVWLKNTPGPTEENLQARLRGLFLMTLSNQTGHIVLTTGNKSEIAVGYTTLYGDMAGGFNVLKDVSKTQVYALAKWRNQHTSIIPERVFTRPPSAELAPNQQDQDTLPPYPILDAMLKAYIEDDLGYGALLDMGFNQTDIDHVIPLIKKNEYKRRQAPIGIRITEKAFGRDRRYPITSGWRIRKTTDN